MATTKRRIHSKGNFIQEEAVAGGAGIYPGMLVKLNSSSQVVVHDDEGGYAECAVALEDVLQGKTVSDVYSSGSLVSYLIPVAGAEVNVLIEAGQDIAVGDKLISAGNGKFKESSDIDSGEVLDQILFIATEACDLTGSGAVDTLCSARKL